MSPLGAYLRGAEVKRDVIRVWFVHDETATHNYVVEVLINTSIL